MIHIPTDDYAGKYLRDYEWSRYPLWMRAVQPLARIYFIIVPPDAEQFADVSFYQLRVDWDTYALHAGAVILRIGQGIWIDTEFERNYAEAKARGLKVGGYWFSDGRYSPQQQRDKLLQATAGKSFEMEVFIDWERNYNGAHEGIENVVALMQTLEGRVVCRDIGTYTGYYWFLENTNPLTHADQYNYLKNKPLWLAWYAAASVVRIPAPWTDWTHWQFGTPVVSWGQGSVELDMNKSSMTRAQFGAFYGDEPEPPPPSTTQEYQKIRRYNSDTHVLIIDPKEQRVRVTNTNGTLERLSHAAQRLGAKYAVNGDGWYVSPPSPLSIAASNGDVYQDVQLDFRPFLNVSRDGAAVIRHNDFPAFYNTVSGTRYLLRSGIRPAYLSGTDIQYIERHPRTAAGITQSGELIFVVVDGRSVVSAGVTLLELANILLEFGAWEALELDGGGSSEMVVDGQIVNVPSDGAERAVINHVIIGQSTGGSMSDYYDIVGTDGHNHRVRQNHDVRSAYLVGRDITNTVHARAGTAAEDVYIFPADVPDSTIPGGLAAKAGDIWRKVYQVGSDLVVGWTAEKHLSMMQGISIRLIMTNPPPAEPTLPVSWEVTQIAKDAAGNVVATYKGTLTKE